MAKEFKDYPKDMQDKILSNSKIYEVIRNCQSQIPDREIAKRKAQRLTGVPMEVVESVFAEKKGVKHDPGWYEQEHDK